MPTGKDDLKYWYDDAFHMFDNKLDFIPDESIEMNSLNKRTILYRSDSKKLFGKPVLIAMLSILDSDERVVEYCKWISACGEVEEMCKEFFEYVQSIYDAGWAVEIHNMGIV